tara:strand:- start:2581 stop:2997 length:417 start_codon:yes stop_codon:yes gene_type:complete
MNKQNGKRPTARRARRKPPKKKDAPVDMGVIEYKRLKLKEIRGDIELARLENKTTGLSQLHRLEIQMHDEIADAVRAQGESAADMTTEELMGYILETILELPAGVQDQIAATLQAVREGAIVKLGEAPKKRRAKRAKS